MRALHTPFDRWDGLLFGLGLLGVLVFVALLPDLHPDAALDARLGEEGAIEAATAFLERNGYETNDLKLRAHLARNVDLLDSLQTHLGRPAAIEALKGEAGRRLPAYLWNVDVQTPSDLGEEAERSYTVLLDEEGGYWHFENAGGLRPPVRRAAVAYALANGAAALHESNDLAAAVTDSLLAAAFTFHTIDSLWSRPPGTLRWDGQALRDRLDEPERLGEVRLGPEAAVAYARYHLAQSSLAKLSMQPDSVWTSRERPATAHVRFVTTEPYLGQTVQADIEVGAAGALAGMTTTFNQREHVRRAVDDDETVQFSFGPDEVAGFLRYLTYVILLVVLLFVFIRRTNLRLVDVSAGIRDAAVATLFAGTTVGILVGPEMITEVDNLLVGLGIVGVAVVGSGLAMGLPIFVMGSAADSVTRETWPSKQETLTLLRRAAVRNVPVGASLLRSLALAGVFIGVFTVVLLLLPDALLDFEGDGDRSAIMLAQAASPLAYYASSYVVYALFWMLAVLLGAGTLLYRWRPRAAVVCTGLVVLAVLTKLSAVELQPAPYAWIQAGLLGVALAIAFWRYDALTCFLALLFFGLTTELAPGWLAEGLDAHLDALAVVVLAGLVAVVGVVGLMSGRTSAELPDYVPAYVREMAQQQRLERELEIAYQVQASFLPARMPEVEGLDLAAMCLAAHEVGGDYYDVVEIEPGRLGIVIGDVSGKGIEAAFFMTLVKGIWQTLCRSGTSPVDVVRRLNELFCANAPRGTFISLIYGVLDVQARTFTFARAGHNPVIHKRRDEHQARLVCPAGMAIGLTDAALFARSVEEETIALDHGDVLVFYTDGFSEAMNRRHEQFGDDRIARRVERTGARPARDILEAVSSDVHHFSESVGRHDDMTMVVVKVDGQAAGTS